MSISPSSYRILCLLSAAILTSCASVSVKYINDADSKAYDCKLPVFNDASEISGTYEVLCEMESITGSTLFNKRTAQAAIERCEPAACRCGADAMLVTYSGKTDFSFTSWRRGTATVQAIKIKNSASL